MATYWISGWKLSDFTGALSASHNAGSLNGKGFVGTSVTLSDDAEKIVLQVFDDDDRFEDAYIETGTVTKLAADLDLDGDVHPANTSHVELEFRLVTDNVPPVNFFIGRVGSGVSNSGSNELVFTDHPLKPGDTYTFCERFDGQTTPYETICFSAGTLIDTPRGPFAVEHLRPGDPVLTRDRGAQRILWAGQRHLTPEMLASFPNLRPVRIRAGALGAATPARDLVVSPQHRIVIDGRSAELFFGETSVLVAARALCNDRNVTIEPADNGITYCHILLKQHELVRANGQWAETLLCGPQAIAALDADQIAEIEHIFPGMLTTSTLPACPILPVHEARILAPNALETRLSD